jgi:hypothetical protein
MQPVQKRTGAKPPFSGEKKREATNQAHEELRKTRTKRNKYKP